MSGLRVGKAQFSCAVPTHQSVRLKVGTLSLCPPYKLDELRLNSARSRSTVS
jgi:hypothetical protein